MTAKRKHSRLGALYTAITYVVVLLFIFPVLWTVITGFKTESQAYSSSPLFLFQPTVHQFLLAFGGGFWNYFSNSLLASTVSTVVALFLGVPCAYVMVFYMHRNRSKNLLFFILSTRFMPFAAIIVPLYVIFEHFNLLNNIFSLIIVYTAMNLPLVVWMSRSYFMDLPNEVMEASLLDGCSKWGALLRVAIPMSVSGLTATALLSIVFAWNDFFFAVNLTFTHSGTLPIMVSSFMTNEGLFIAKVSALATLIIIVPVILGLYAQKHLVRGLTAGAIK